MTDTDIPNLSKYLYHHPKIKTVWFSSFNKISAMGVMYFAKHNKTVTAVRFDNILDGDKAIMHFAICNTVVTNACFGTCNITAKGAKDFATHNKMISKLDLPNNTIGNDGIRDLALNTVITKLDVYQNKIGAEGAKYIGRYNQVAIDIDLYKNTIGDQGAEDFSKYNTVACTLNVGSNNISDKGLEAFVHHNKKISNVNFSGNTFTALGILTFCVENKIIDSVDFCNCKLNDEAAEYIGSLNRFATYIRLPHNSFTEAGIKHLLNNSIITNSCIYSIGYGKISSEINNKFIERQKNNAIYQRQWAEICLLMVAVNKRVQAAMVPALINLIAEFAGFEKIPPLNINVLLKSSFFKRTIPIVKMREEDIQQVQAQAKQM